jgi:hypothetical protein
MILSDAQSCVTNEIMKVENLQRHSHRLLNPFTRIGRLLFIELDAIFRANFDLFVTGKLLYFIFSREI